ncbi:methionyl-tRNA formyltransferase [Halochromatium roseum]|uniref:methionyl-tRNA formyltransferase n=1 Tax=Halochromatium roseum TaxID=391920 RepID=UPI0030843929
MIIGYFADGPWSHRALDKLLEEKRLKIAFICARYDHPDQMLKAKAEKNSIPFLFHPNINSADFLQSVEQYGSELFVSMSFNQIFRKSTIERPVLGTINCHAGKLPFYRGRNILNWALINDEKEFGITVHYVDTGVDTGDIIRQQCFPITDADDYSTLLDRAYVGCADLLDQAIGDILAGTAMRRPQAEIHPRGFYCTARGQGDERLNWQQPSRRVFNFVRAICPPGPAARCFRGNEEIRINSVDYLSDAPTYIGIPGAVLAKDAAGFLVKTADSYVRVIDWDADFKLKVGDRLT